MRDWQFEHLCELFELGEKAYILDERGEFPLIYVDESFCRMLGYGQQELYAMCRKKGRELIYYPDINEVREIVEEGLKQSGKYTCCYRMRKKNGELIWVWESGTFLTGEDNLKHIKSIVVNVTNGEGARKERDAIYDNIPGGVLTLLITDSNFYITEANRQCFEMLGTLREEYLGSSGMYTFPEDLPTLRKVMVKQAANREPIDCEFRSYSGKDRKIRWYRLMGNCFNEAEDGAEYLATLFDITESKQAVFRLEEEKERYRIAVGVLSDFFFEYTVASQCLRVYGNPQENGYDLKIPEESTGSMEELLQKGGFVHPDDYERLLSYLNTDKMETAKVRLLTVRRETSEEAYQWYEVQMSKIPVDGKVSRIIGSGRNIREQMEKEREYEEIQKVYDFRMDKIFETILRISVSDGSMKTYFWGNEKEPGFPGDSFEKFVEKMAEDYVHPADKEHFRKAMNLSHMQDVLQFSKTEETLFFRIRRKGKYYRHKCFRYKYYGTGKEEILLNSQDVHYFREEQIKEEEAKRRMLSEAMNEARAVVEMKRNFYAMLSRELWNPLQYVRSALQRMDDMHDKNVYQAVLYMSSVVDHILEYEKLEKGVVQFENRQFQLQKLLDKCFSVWEKKAEEWGIQFQYNVNLQCMDYYGDEVRFLQILNHIIGNCIMASENGGTVEIWVSDIVQSKTANRIVITVEDWGIPVMEDNFGREYPVEVRDNAKDWKEFGNEFGTAFSLMVARKLVERMGGQIMLRRSEDTSNILDVTMLLQKISGTSDSMKIRNDKEEEENEKILQKYSILLVGHPERKHILSSAMLQLNGAKVNMVFNGMAALTLFESVPENSFDAILVEANLGDMDYLEFTEQFRKMERTDAKRVPIIALLEEVSQETIQIGMQFGVNAWLDTPSDMKRLRLMLDTLYS